MSLGLQPDTPPPSQAAPEFLHVNLSVFLSVHKIPWNFFPSVDNNNNKKIVFASLCCSQCSHPCTAGRDPTPPREAGIPWLCGILVAHVHPPPCSPLPWGVFLCVFTQLASTGSLCRYWLHKCSFFKIIYNDIVRHASLLSQQGCLRIYYMWEKVNKFVFMLKKSAPTTSWCKKKRQYKLKETLCHICLYEL